MIVQERVSLALHTTLRVGGEARYFVRVETPEDLREAVALARTKNLPWYVLGEGSNVLAPDEGYEGVVIQMMILGCKIISQEKDTLLVSGAGVSWEEVVHQAAQAELWGIENLAGIPGTVGAAPIQNIGAYGSEFAETLLWIEAYDAIHDCVVRLTKEECAFGYRDSVFKERRELIVVQVALSLAKYGQPNFSYKDLQTLVGQGVSLTTPKQVGDAVRSIRRKKFPDLRREGTAGSFFKNPVISPSEYQELVVRYPELPGFPQADGVKVPLAFILDAVLQLKGHAFKNARLFEAQPLVLVTTHPSSEKEVETLARDVEERVYKATHIRIQREVRSVRA